MKRKELEKNFKNKIQNKRHTGFEEQRRRVRERREEAEWEHRSSGGEDGRPDKAHEEILQRWTPPHWGLW